MEAKLVFHPCELRCVPNAACCASSAVRGLSVCLLLLLPSRLLIAWLLYAG